MADWSFYGRDAPLAQLRKILGSARWFFCRISGRRRIGKTTLLRELARSDEGLSDRLLYLQVPDSDERDVATSFRRQMEESEFEGAAERAADVTDFLTMAKAIGWACRAGMVVVLDEFQYFTRAKMTSFNSFLQAEVDALRNENLKEGGLFVLGSLQSEMNALLDDKGAPLYGRITNKLELDHWDFEDLLDVFSSQGVNAPSQWLTLWTFFEGVPKFYHDAYVQGLYEVGPERFSEELLTRMFMSSSSPLSEEADTWFLRELRGKGVSVLHYLSEHPGCSHGESTTQMRPMCPERANASKRASIFLRAKGSSNPCHRNKADTVRGGHSPTLSGLGLTLVLTRKAAAAAGCSFSMPIARIFDRVRSGSLVMKGNLSISPPLEGKMTSNLVGSVPSTSMKQKSPSQ